MKTEKKVNSPKKTKRKLRPQSAKDQKNQTVGSNKRIDLDAKASMKSDFHDYAQGQPRGSIQATNLRSSTPTLPADRAEAIDPVIPKASSFTSKRPASKGRSRPQSAAYGKESNYTDLERKSEKGLPISSNQKALKTFGNINWTKSWFSKAYVTTPQARAET